jgi:molecular chaperone DnaK (HSP70)
MRRVIGLDFGTTNSAIAVADAGKEATLACFGAAGDTTTSFRSILYFPIKDRSSTSQIGCRLEAALNVEVPAQVGLVD